MTVVLPPNEEECWTIVLHPDKPSILEGSFEMLDDDLTPEPVGFTIRDSERDRVLYRAPRRSRRGTFSITPELHQLRLIICMQNGSAAVDDGGRRRKSNGVQPNVDGEDRTLGVEINVTPRKIHQEIQDTNAKLLNRAEVVGSKVKLLMVHQEYMRAREGKQRDLVETTFDQLLVWVCSEAVLLMLIALGQVMYLRRFLEQRHYM